MIDRLLRGGTESQLLALVNGLDRTRFEPILCLRDGEDEESRSLEPANCEVIRLGIRSVRSPSTWFKLWKFVRLLRRRQVAIVQVYFPESTYYGVLAARLAGVPWMVRTRNNLGYWMTPFHRTMGKLANRYVDALIANCEPCREAVIADEGFPAEKIVVLENGVDADRFSEVNLHGRGRVPGNRRIGVVANLDRVKGLPVFFEAATHVIAGHPDTVFEIAGEGPLRPELEQLRAERGLQGHLHLLGSIASVPEFLGSLEIAVLPSLSEGLSNSLLEYMAAGKAIVATAVGGNKRLIENGVHGLLVPPADSAALASAIRRLLEDPELATRLGTKARRRANEEFSRQAMIGRFQRFYLQLMMRSLVN